MTAEVGTIWGPRVRTAKPRIDFWHGASELSDWDAVWGLVQQRARWVKAHFGPNAFEDKPKLREFSDYDFEDGGYSLNDYGTRLLKPQQYLKAMQLLDQQEFEHDEHHFVQLRPFCPTCRGHRTIAMLSLCSWMVRNAGRTPVNPSDRDLPWDTEQVVEEQPIDQGALFMHPADLANMPRPAELIEGILPTKGVGYITGRDRSLKTFLAIDICMHVATQQTHWHRAPNPDHGWQRPRREMGWEGYGRFIFAAGEGVSSFYPRIRAWELGQHVQGAGPGSPPVEGGGTAVRLDDCTICAKLEDPYEGHVNHVDYDDAGDFVLRPGLGVEENGNMLVRRGTVDLFAGGNDYRFLLAMAKRLEPDVIVLDTLALSSGAADQQSNSEMGQVHARAAELAAASDGLVIVIAHTDKGDNDARGASAIEDNADFVLHCHRESDSELDVKVAKRKDADDNWDFKLQVQHVDLGPGEPGSIILRDWDPTLSTNHDDPEGLTDSQRATLRGVEEYAVNTGRNLVTLAELMAWTDKPRSTIQEALDDLVALGKLETQPGRRGRGGAAKWWMPHDQLEFVRSLGHEILDHDAAEV